MAKESFRTKIQRFRSSAALTIFVVCAAVFSDTLLLNIVVPILPFILTDRVHLSAESAQEWNAVLLASCGGALIVGSCEFPDFL